MPTDDVTAPTAAWLGAYLDMKLPEDQLAAAGAATRRAVAGMAAHTGALAMEDEPANFIAALARLADRGR